MTPAEELRARYVDGLRRDGLLGDNLVRAFVTGRGGAGPAGHLLSRSARLVPAGEPDQPILVPTAWIRR
ncbi:hypothetical protein ACN28C_16690 [Plantactinospora sp. WMMC1484]|uniref:hypothetical protein n=1 Tax=Plantactinospora sp. WMMC1484 TaxID=3404122 RepID=UPI003BF52876